MKSSASILTLFLGALSLWFIPSMNLHAQASQYCYGESCFASLTEAESYMRGQADHGAYLERSGSSVKNPGSNSPSLVISYAVKNRPPIRFYAPGYSNGASSPGGAPFCSKADDPYFGYGGMCASEEEMNAEFMAYMRRSYPDCSLSNESYQGSYAEPFVFSSAVGGHGQITFDTPQGRWFHYDIQCPSWPASDPRKNQLQKFQNFDCEAGFWPVWGYSPEYNNSGNPDYIAIWPNLCTAGQIYAYIEVRSPLGITQTSSCAANLHPCFPATGDKLRVEEDFDFAGRPFARYYHSLQQIQISDTMAQGWGHSYLEKIGYDGVPYLMSAEGYFEKFVLLSGNAYRGSRNESDLLIRQGNTWLLKRPGGEQRTYNTDGLLTNIFFQAAPDRSVSLSYQKGRLLQVMDGLGRTLSFYYENGLLSALALSDGSTVHYEYDAERNLAAVVRQDGSRREYVYNESGAAPASIRHLLTGIVEDGVRYASFTYVDDGKVASSGLHVDAGMVEKTTLNYVDNGAVLVTQPNGTSYQYTIGAGAFRQVTGIVGPNLSLSRTFTDDGRLAASVDGNGVRNTWSYDESLSGGGSSITEVEAAGKAEQRTRTRIRDADNQIVQLRSSTSQGVSSITNYVYSANGALSAQCTIDPSSASALAYNCGSASAPQTGVRQQLLKYCSADDVTGSTCPMAGLLMQKSGPRTDVDDVTGFTYYPTDDSTCSTSSATCSHRKGDLWKVTNALGQVTEYLAYDGAGRVLSVKDANGVVTDYTYHPRGWLTASKVRGADDSSESDDRITSIDYWPTGLVKQVTQPDGAFTRFTYDAAHRLTDIADNAGNTIHYTLDNAGNRSKEDTKDASGTLKRTLSRVYNQLGQLATQATAQGDPTDFGYDGNGNTKTVTDALGHVTQNDYDPLNRLARTLQDVGGIAAETKFGYDALDNLTKVTDPKGLDTTYVYNGLGDLTKLTSPDTGSTTYTYDSAGNRATQTDARNIKTSYGYDALNRLTQVTYPTTSLNVSYTYDVSQSTCASGETYGIGRLTRMQDGSGSTDYCYDRFGDLVRKVQTTNGKVFVVRYAYTKAGQLSRLTYPDGAVVDYVRNAQGQTTEVGVTPPGGTRQVLLNQATYYPFGPVAGWTYGNGRPMQRVLDQDYRPLAVNDTRSDGLAVGFAFDPVGNLSALTAPGNTAPVIKLDYDPLGRLTAFKDGPTDTVIDGYTYDATGNRLSAKVNTSTQTYSYPSTSHSLSSVAGTARSYDAAGNTTAIGGTAVQYVYGANGRLTQVKRSGTVVANYAYNGRSEQVRRVGSTNTYTLYDESGHWLGDYDNDGAVVQQAIWLDDLPVGVLAKTTLRYVQPDHLGTPRAVIDPARDVAIWRWDLKGEAFGSTAPDQDPDKDGTAFVLDMRFPGQRYDALSGLNQNYFRDYEPGTGRYVQSDLIGLSGGVSTYSYVFSMPLEMRDASGLVAVPLPVPMPGIPPPHPLVWAALGGLAIGEGFNYTYEYFSGGSPGTDLYDWTHPQYSQSSDESGVDDIPASKAVPVPYPDRFRGGFSCICRANRDGRSPDNCSNGDQQSALGYGRGATLSEAKRMAEKNAKDNLGAKSTHHVQCRCTGPKGDRIIPHG
ncbi:RHS repeat domain-containing protein [Xanthomonas sp. 3498]|uniref:RHS repeat domain-containing protein n=1 Tax=Xanthomonas sp. 3498 TaxID=2663863 RepID=UPI0017D88C34|nr:RHS repeat domain-containing protein [Xanthomonas sp. 3498]MBB5874910.1 RHS repeat-associated protein [Xanthomonas sp. 3498]